MPAVATEAETFGCTAAAATSCSFALVFAALLLQESFEAVLGPAVGSNEVFDGEASLACCDVEAGLVQDYGTRALAAEDERLPSAFAAVVVQLIRLGSCSSRYDVWTCAYDPSAGSAMMSSPSYALGAYPCCKGAPTDRARLYLLIWLPRYEGLLGSS